MDKRVELITSLHLNDVFFQTFIHLLVNDVIFGSVSPRNNTNEKVFATRMVRIAKQVFQGLPLVSQNLSRIAVYNTIFSSVGESSVNLGQFCEKDFNVSSGTLVTLFGITYLLLYYRTDFSFQQACEGQRARSTIFEQVVNGIFYFIFLCTYFTICSYYF